MTSSPESSAATLKLGNGATIAYHASEGKTPGVVFLGGFMSDMSGTKATALEAHCRKQGRAFIRFDYQGHGESSGEFADGTIGSWTDDALAILDEVSDGPQILIGSSMGGWIMLLAALARPDRVAGLIGLAAAPDFTSRLLWDRLPEQAVEALKKEGVFQMPSEYGDQPYTITMDLIEEGRNHLLLDDEIALDIPVRLIHGIKDDDVPWDFTRTIQDQLKSDDVTAILIKDGDHRLSRDQDIERICAELDDLCAKLD